MLSRLSVTWNLLIETDDYFIDWISNFSILMAGYIGVEKILLVLKIYVFLREPFGTCFLRGFSTGIVIRYAKKIDSTYA